MPFVWNCPFCSLTQTVTSEKHTSGINSLHIKDQAEGHIAIRTEAIGCSNPECRKTTIEATVAPAHYSEYLGLKPGYEPLFQQFLRPQGFAKPQPAYIPQPIREDYYEACLIRDLSPKASATLVRRCLQGMIRDFAGISKNRLIDEIKALRQAVDDGEADRAISIESVDAIDHVRSIGNIGAHMEKSIDLIVEVDQGEAQALIELVEMLFEEWYAAREKRQARLARIDAIGGAKKDAKVAITGPNALAALTAPGKATDLVGNVDAKGDGAS